MEKDPYKLAEILCSELRASQQEDWAIRIEDTIQGGSTGSETIMGLKWNLEELLKLHEVEEKTERKVIALLNELTKLLK